MSDARLDDLYDLIDGIEVAMLASRRRDGQLVSRAMQTQRRTAARGSLVRARASSPTKFEELAFDPTRQSSPTIADRTREWVSVSGKAILSQDRDLIADCTSLIGDLVPAAEGIPTTRKRGTPDDPRIALILVEAQAVTYYKSDRPLPLVLFDRRASDDGRSAAEPRRSSARVSQDGIACRRANDTNRRTS